MVLDYKDIKISWLCHSGFRISDRKILYIDPYQIGHGPNADIIFITHEHFDHCNLEDIETARVLVDSLDTYMREERG